MPRATYAEIIDWMDAAEIRETLEEQSNPNVDGIHAVAVMARARLVGYGILKGFRTHYEQGETDEESLAYDFLLSRTEVALTSVGLGDDIMSFVENRPADIPIEDELIMGVAEDMYPNSKGIGARTVRKLRKGYDKFNYASDVLSGEPSEFEVTRWSFYRDSYAHYKGLYLRPGQLSFNRLNEMFQEGSIRELYDIGKVSGYLLETFIRSVMQAEEN